jgi:hypothetical protein
MANTRNPRLRDTKDGQFAPALASGEKRSGRVFGYVIDDPSFRTKLPEGISLAVVSQRRFPASSLKGMFKLKKHAVTLQTEPQADPAADAYLPDARARALLRGIKVVEQDLKASGGAFTLEQVKELMHDISRQAISNRVIGGTLLAVRGPNNRATYPVAQFMPDGQPVEGLKEVRDALAADNAWTVLNFLVNPEPKLGGRKPIDLLKAGGIDEVVEAARRAGTQGA